MLSAFCCCTTSLCELFCDYFNAIKALLYLSTVLISTTLIKNWFIHHWLYSTETSTLLDNCTFQTEDTSDERHPQRIAWWEWLYPMVTDSVCISMRQLESSFGQTIVLVTGFVVKIPERQSNGCIMSSSAGMRKKLIKTDIKIIKAVFILHCDPKPQ